MSALVGCKSVTIYLGNVCNFNCTYCDRDYIKQSIGGQHMTTDDIPSVVDFFNQVGFDENPPDLVTFHGGEPFSYVKIMDKMMDALEASIKTHNFAYYIQTNGSQLVQHRWFFEKWGPRLEVSISYDFVFQEINRSKFEVSEALQMMKQCGVRGIQFQFVMPLDNPKVFGLPVIKSITDVCFKNGVKRINLIPLRHIRGKDKFDVIIDRINIPQFFDAFLKFIQVLYVLGIDVVVDGHGHSFDKHYFNNHKQLVLSPDGYLYPEFDFLEYQRIETTLGTWRHPITINRMMEDMQEDNMLQDQCVTCPSRSSCGLKYLHGMFDTQPKTDNCVLFYQMMMVAIKHAQKLKQQPSLMYWVGI